MESSCVVCLLPSTTDPNRSFLINSCLNSATNKIPSDRPTLHSPIHTPSQDPDRYCNPTQCPESSLPLATASAPKATAHQASEPASATILPRRAPPTNPSPTRTTSTTRSMPHWGLTSLCPRPPKRSSRSQRNMIPLPNFGVSRTHGPAGLSNAVKIDTPAWD